MIEVHGIVAAGLGNAAGNFQQGGVEAAVANLLRVSGIAHGTLNVEIAQEYAVLDDGVYDVELPDSDYNGREHVKVKRCMVNGFPCAIVRPADHFVVEKFRRRIEVMSSVRLRDRLGLSDGSTVIVQFQGNQSWWDQGGSNTCMDAAP
jgi:CTP-dependent riboflavin kinase